MDIKASDAKLTDHGAQKNLASLNSHRHRTLTVLFLSDEFRLFTDRCVIRRQTESAISRSIGLYTNVSAKRARTPLDIFCSSAEIFQLKFTPKYS